MLLSDDTPLSELNWLLIYSFASEAARRQSAHLYPRLPLDSSFLNTLYRNNREFPAISQEEVNTLGVTVYEAPSDHYYNLYLQGLAKIFGIPYPKLYFIQSDITYGRYNPLSSSMVIGGDLTNAPVMQFTLAHEFAHGLRLAALKLASSDEEVIRIEKFCDAFARIVRIEGFPANDQSQTFIGIAQTEVAKINHTDFTRGIEPQVLFDHVMQRTWKTHPSYLARVMETKSPHFEKRLSEAEFARAVGDVAYSRALLRYAASRAMNMDDSILSKGKTSILIS